MSEIVYFFGAGASYNSIPVVDGFSKRLKIFIEFIKDGSNKWKKVDSLLVNIENEFSPDTLAKKVYHLGRVRNDLSDYYLLKRVYSAYLIFEQTSNYWNPKRLTKNNLKEDKELALKIKTKLDNRYDSFLAACLRETGRGVSLSNNISFLSWNYDTQLELSLQQFLTSNSYEDASGIFEKKLIKLNGEANFCNHDFFTSSNKVKKQLYIDAIFDKKDNTSMKFAWDSDVNSELIQDASARIKRADTVVIIGYSFPFYNRSIDKRLFEGKTLHRDMKIVIQDPSKEKCDFIRTSICEINKINNTTPEWFDRIMPHNADVSQFHMPSSLF